MGIIIDLILVGIIALSAFLGYKKGLVELGVKLFAGIIAIVLTLMLYKPVANIIIKNTPIDEKIENVILENTTQKLEEKTSENQYLQYATTGINEQAEKMTKDITINIIYAVTALVLFIVSKIVLNIVLTLVNFIAKLPILKQFNEVGGLAYGIIRGVLIVGVIIILMGIFIKFKPDNFINKELRNTFLTKEVYEIIVKF